MTCPVLSTAFSSVFSSDDPNQPILSNVEVLAMILYRCAVDDRPNLINYSSLILPIFILRKLSTNQNIYIKKNQTENTKKEKKIRFYKKIVNVTNFFSFKTMAFFFSLKSHLSVAKCCFFARDCFRQRISGHRICRYIFDFYQFLFYHVSDVMKSNIYVLCSFTKRFFIS